MIIICPSCGKSFVVGHLGRRPLDIVVSNVCDTIRKYHSLRQAAEALGCSRGYIYGILKKNGMTLQKILESNT